MRRKDETMTTGEFWVLLGVVGIGALVFMAAVAYALGGIMNVADQWRQERDDD